MTEERNPPQPYSTSGLPGREEVQADYVKWREERAFDRHVAAFGETCRDCGDDGPASAG